MNKIKATILVAFLYGSNAFAAELLINQAKSVNIKSCLPTISALDNFFRGNGNNYGAWSTWASESPDEQIFSSSLEITFNNGSHLIDLTIAPTKDNQCSYSYTRTFYSEKNCIAFSRTKMKSATYEKELNKNVTIFKDGSVNWYLMPAGNGCMIQKKEVGIRFKQQIL
jgi:hypothetical protein